MEHILITPQSAVTGRPFYRHMLPTEGTNHGKAMAEFVKTYHMWPCPPIGGYTISQMLGLDRENCVYRHNEDESIVLYTTFQNKDILFFRNDLDAVKWKASLYWSLSKFKNQSLEYWDPVYNTILLKMYYKLPY
jgi:hypothetical protein